MRPQDVQPSVPVVFEGFVFDADGAPGEGAVVVSSAGGRAVVDRNGSYRLEASAPRDAASVQLVAFGEGGGAKISVALTPATRTTRVDPLLLSPGAVCEPGWLPTFTGLLGMGNVEALAIYDDGRGPALYVCSPGGIWRWDGSSRELLGAVGGVTDPMLLALQVHDDGSGPALFAGGWFTTVNGVPANRIAKWDGTSWTALGSGANSHVRALAAYDDGSGPALYAGGSFTSAGGAPASRIAKWDGSDWTALGSGVNSGVQALAVHDDGSGPSLFVGGSFTIAGGVTGFARMAKWNGSTWSKLGTGVNGGVFVLKVFSDGGGPALYAGGSFTTAGGALANHVARWNGSSWAALGGGLADPVLALADYDDGSGSALYAGGRLSKWDGSSWTSVGTGLGPYVGALMAYDDGNGPVLLAGTGDFADDVVVHKIAKWDGASFEPLVPPGKALNGRVEEMAVFDDGSGPALYASGLFTTAGDIGPVKIARWDGSRWTDVGAPGGLVSALMTFDDGSGPALVAGGWFSPGGGPDYYIAKWDGSSWAALGQGLQRAIVRLTSHDDGSGPGLVASVAFLHSGEYFDRIMRWNGSSWTQLGGDFPHVFPYHLYPSVADMAAFDDGSGPALYAGGLFTTAGGVTASNIARWDGSSWAPLGSGTNGGVGSLEVFDDGSGPALFVSGGFTDAGGVPAPNGIAKWDGSSWSALASEPGSQLGAVTVWDDGSGPAFYASVGFTTPEGWWADLARFDGSVWTPYSAGSIDGSIWVMTGFDDGERSMLYVGGQFTNSYTGESYLSRWGCPLATLHRKTRVR